MISVASRGAPVSLSFPQPEVRLKLENHSMKQLVCCALFLALALSPSGCRKANTGAAAAPPPPAIKVKAGDLLKEYSTNAIAADGKYKDKVIEVTGKFNSVQKAIGLGFDLQLLAEDADELNAVFVHCFLTEAGQTEAGKLKGGEKITVQGTCDGQYLAQVKLSKCTIVK
jgi:hypothetical protein